MTSHRCIQKLWKGGQAMDNKILEILADYDIKPIIKENVTKEMDKINLGLTETQKQQVLDLLLRISEDSAKKMLLSVFKTLEELGKVQIEK